MARRRDPDPTAMLKVVATILTELKKDDLHELANQTEDELFLNHFGIGMWIRNRFEIWHDEELLRSCGTFCADDASGKILREVWLRAKAMCGQE